MDVNNIAEIKDGDPARPLLVVEAPPIVEVSKPKHETNFKKKRRRGKTKRKIMKPFSKVPWQERRKNDQSKRINRFRKIVLAKTQAPFNNNQFLMEIHKPEPENNFHNLRTPSARTRDSSFSVDSEDNYFFSLPEDEEEYLTKEFSSVYEDAQSERLNNMSKTELIEEYLVLQTKYDNLVKRTERYKIKEPESDNATIMDKDSSTTDRESMLTDPDTSETSASCSTDEPSIAELMQRLKEQDEQIRDLQVVNDTLKAENDHLRHQTQGSSEDSESDSSSSSDSASNSSRCDSPGTGPPSTSEVLTNGNQLETNGIHENTEDLQSSTPLLNGYHNPSD
ncbi:PREDICTED: protein HEXIM [Papilio xuthus]|uniref:Protein HEXIM n=1 Tax=Papilio xuthus TaxID=66420 RepID=A0AAJ7EBW2_PAPXU|nr:PREDICTED: protein HEXIM [Papilio xuthus]